MKKKLTNSEIAKVFAMYYPCEVLVDASKMHKGVGKDMDITKVVAVFDAINKNVDINQFVGITYKGENGLWFYDIFDSLCRVFQEFVKPDFCKLLLTPLSKISDEDAIAVYKIELPNGNLNAKGELEFYKKRLSERVLSVIPSDVIEELKLRGYAVKLHFGVGHWANGKTAIELNIAIEKVR